MHAQTKFCFFAYDRNREQLNDVKGLFRKNLGRALFDEHYPAPVIKLFNDRLEDVHIGLAQDRRVLGFINERVHDEMIAGLTLRRTPMVKEKQSYAVDQMRDVLLRCPELKEVAIPPAEHRPEELERFFRTLLAKRGNP